MNLHDNTARERYVLGGYEIIETTGAGGMGVVYRATDLALGRQVALKVLRDDFRAHPQIVARFRREAEAFATLDHPNIVKVFAVGAVGEIPYFAMEYVTGRPLNEVLQERKRLPWREALGIGLQVAEALADAHDAAIIHRDIKPANIIIDDHGKAFVTDFGIAKVLNAANQLTVDGTRLGTPQYMCPERCQNHEITTASDVYSLGVLLFQCISGRLPHQASTPVDLIRKISVEPAPRLRGIVPEAPESVERLLAYMLEKDPRNRPRSGGALAAAISRVLEGKPLDEHADELAGAIAAFRSSGDSTPLTSDANRSRSTTVLDGLTARWFRISRGFRILMALLLVAGALASAALVAFKLTAVESTPGLGLDPGLAVARWNESGQIARYLDEAPGVRILPLDAPDFAVSRIFAVAGDASVFVELHGDSSSERRGQHALVLITPSVQSTSIVLPPRPTSQTAAHTLIGAAHSEAGVLSCLYSIGDATYLRPVAPGGADTIFSTDQIGVLATDLSSRSVVFSQRAASAGWRLVQESLEPSGGGTALTEPGPPIRALAFDATSGTVAYVRDAEDGKSGRLYLRNLANTDLDAGVLLAEGQFNLHAGAVNPVTGAVAAVRKESDGASTLLLLAASGTGAPIEVGAGLEAFWNPDGKSLVVSAPDYAGRTQIWLIGGEAPFERKQLTHLGSGTSASLLPLEGGRQVAAFVPGSSTIVVAEIPAAS